MRFRLDVTLVGMAALILIPDLAQAGGGGNTPAWVRRAIYSQKQHWTKSLPR